MVSSETPQGRQETLPEMLIKRLQEETRNDARWSALLRRLSSLSFAVGAVLLLLLLHNRAPYEWLPSPLLFGAMLFGLTGMEVRWVQRLRKERQQRLIHKLKQDTRAVGPLLQLMYPEQETAILQVAAEALKAHLPQLQAVDAAQITLSQREALHFLLESSDKEMVLVTLQALKQVGDRSAIQPVEMLIRYTDKIHVNAEAKRCLACLRERAEAQERAQTLLRPASFMAGASEMLLRPAAESTVCASEQLLRPTR